MIFLLSTTFVSYAVNICLNVRYVLESPHMKKFFDYIQLPSFDIAADVAATFKVVASFGAMHIL